MFVTNSGEEKSTLGRYVLAFLKDNLDGRNHLASITETDAEISTFLQD